MSAQPNNPDLQAEIEKYKKALEEDPNSRLFAALADSLRRAGQIEDAISVAEEGVARHPRYLSGITVLAKACQADENYERALELFGQVVKMNPENIMAQKALAEIYNRTGDHKNALKAYNAITILDPSDQAARQQLEILEATSPKEPPLNTAPSEERTADKDEESLAEEEEESPAPQKMQDQEEKEQEQEQSEAENENEAPSESKEPGMEKEDGESSPEPDPDKTIELSRPDTNTRDDKETAETAEKSAGANEEPAEDQSGYDTDPGTPPPAAMEWGPDRSKKELEDNARDRPEVTEQVQDQKSAKALSKQEELDRFFEGASPSRQNDEKPAEAASENEPAPAIADSDAEKTRDPETQGITITRSQLGSLFWAQGFHEKALMVMTDEVASKPGDIKLRNEFVSVCDFLGRDPDEVLAQKAVAAGDA